MRTVMRRHGAGFMVDDLDYAAAETQDPRPLAVGSRLDKHGFYPEAKSAPAGLNCDQWETMLRTSAAT